MDTNPAVKGEEYYKMVGSKNREGVEKFLHPDVHFIGPMATLHGKDAVMQATGNFMRSFTSLTIRAKFGSVDQAMIVYDIDIPGIATNFPGASLLTFRDGLIVKIELFYDSSRFLTKKEEIFS